MDEHAEDPLAYVSFVLRGEGYDAPPEAVWGEHDTDGEPRSLCVLERAVSPGEPLPSDEARDEWDGNPLYHVYPTSMRGKRAAQSNYGASMGNQLFGGGPFAADPRFGGATGVYAFHGHDPTGKDISGVFSHTDYGASLTEIRDGASKTIMLGEVRPKCSWHVRDGWMHWNSLSHVLYLRTASMSATYRLCRIITHRVLPFRVRLLHDQESILPLFLRSTHQLGDQF